MNTGYLARHVCAVLGIWLLLLITAQAQTKYIRLRNEVISTTPAAQNAAAAAEKAVNPPVSGLFLIQFRDHPQSAWTEQLRVLGIELLWYVPDDTFVARLNQVPLSRVTSLPFVQWVGRYRPAHKVHASLGAPPNGQAAGGVLAVRILLSPSATPGELAEARGHLESIHRESHPRFGAVIEGAIAPARLDALAQSPAVIWIEPAPRMKLNDEVASKIVAGDGGPGKTLVQASGYSGIDVTVAVADTGLYTGSTNFMHPDLAGRVRGFFYYGALSDGADEHSHGTHVTGIVAGNGATGETDDNGALYGLGVAPNASILVQRIFDGDGNFEAPASNETLTHDAVRAGADIGSNSWGDDVQGRYDISAAEFDELVRDADAQTAGDQPYILEFSAGNAGPGAQTIDSPAVAKNVIATGASENNRGDFLIYADGQEVMADFSSRGPCEDGRIKPDLVAPGTWISSLRSPLGNDDNAWGPISDYYLYQGGTSQAGPHASGAAADFVQYYRDSYGLGTPSPALVKAALINSAADMDNSVGDTGPIPNMDEGWGRIDLTQLIGSSRRYQFVDQTQLLHTGQTYEQRVVIVSAGEPFNVTLAYTDVPGFPGAIPALVNDLDLEVVGPDGSIYRGNQFDQGESAPNAPAADNINNVEGLHLSAPFPGEYIVRVSARNVAQDARRDTPAVDQDFALVISGDIPLPGTGLVFFDRTAYTAPSQIRIKLIDADLAGHPSAAVTLKSTTESSGFNVTLLASGASGAFTGTVATATGPATNDVRLQIANGDLIEADYFDASANTMRAATAVADLIPSLISNVSVTNQFGEMVISWTTDEPANSIVRFSSDQSLSFSSTNFTMATLHELALTNLVVGRTYFFAVISTDAAGNTATNNNGGALFSFVVTRAAMVLLVDDYVVDTIGDSQTIPLSSYTNALLQTGISFDVWDTSQQNGYPTLNNLKPYRAVIWRINDSFWVWDGTTPPISPLEQTALTSYVNRGGAFFMASMEVLTREGAGPFRSSVFHLVDFAEDAGVPEAVGAGSEPISSGMDLTLDYSAYPTLEGFLDDPDLSDTVTPDALSTPILFDASSGSIAGLRYPRTGQDSTGRVVFLSFPLDAVPESGVAPNNRANLLRNILGFLIPGLNGLGTIALDNPAYTIPSLVTVEVADSDLEGTGQTAVNLFSDTQPGGQTITLRETVEPGLFRGFITLVAAASPPTNGQLRVQDGDTIRAEYFDASSHAVVAASAVVDAQPPIISNIQAAPDYEQATITWQTSKPADSLVQFGESTFLGRTAYSADFDTSHELNLVGLVPDRLYYFQVISRDRAGNTTVDDHNGQLYTFRTLQPLQPPFVDNFDTGATNWSVFNGEDTQAVWTLGVPNNGQQTSAHSPPNAWGSNLGGASIDTADTFLISPAINLAGGNKATLRFWHSYDFSDPTGDDIIDGGELDLVTSTASQPIPLDQYADASAGWEEVEIDLSSYIGNVIYLAWHYQVFSFGTAPRPGWLLDDVSVTVESVAHGVIQITNNLAQAQFVLSGPTSQSGQGMSTIISNALPGQYVITFSDVAFYQTPAPQTNTLAASTTLVMQGHYTFADSNHNGISDAWEQQVFGTVSPSRTRLTDTDGDGATDYAEFIAGTDPTSSTSKLQLAAPVRLAHGIVGLQWQSVPGRSYRMAGSSDGVNWVPLSDWTQAGGSLSSFTLPAPDSASYMFRLEVHP